MAFPAPPDPPTLFVMEGGEEGRVPVYDGLNRDLPLPLPPAVRIEVFFDSDPVPAQLDFGLAIRDNAVPNGAHFFPAKASDLDPGESWFFRTRHTVDAGGGGGQLNPSTGSQRYALDMDDRPVERIGVEHDQAEHDRGLQLRLLGIRNAHVRHGRRDHHEVLPGRGGSSAG